MQNWPAELELLQRVHWERMPVRIGRVRYPSPAERLPKPGQFFGEEAIERLAQEPDL